LSDFALSSLAATSASASATDGRFDVPFARVAAIALPFQVSP
jgi:hypothetical protein